MSPAPTPSCLGGKTAFPPSPWSSLVGVGVGGQRGVNGVEGRSVGGERVPTSRHQLLDLSGAPRGGAKDDLWLGVRISAAECGGGGG